MRTEHLPRTVHALLRACYQRPHSQCRSRQRSTAAYEAIDETSKNIAVLGGGITGLTAAYLLSRKLPQATITLFETTARLGGWLQSSEVEGRDGRIVFEHGPRTLRPSGASGMATLDLIRRINLEDEILLTPKSSAAAKNRFIYYPNHLVRMPGPGQSPSDIVYSLLSEPIYRGVPYGLASEFLRPPRNEDLQDESIGSFLRRRFSPPLADNIASAVLHGIYAGDIDKLSVKSILPVLWHHEKSAGSVVRGVFTNMLQKRLIVQRKDLEFLQSINSEWHDEGGNMHEHLTHFRKILNASVYTFRAGNEQLSTTLAEQLEAAHNVKIRRETEVKYAQLRESNGTQKVELASQRQSEAPINDPTWLLKESFDYVISSGAHIPTSQPRGALKVKVPSLRELLTPSKATVMVVNLHYPSPSLLSVNGFGYLLPRSIPFSQNPERALGVVFDSDATQVQDSASGTKLTVMLGGHWWQDWPSYPNEQDGLRMARNVLERHLGIREHPDAWKATLQVDCIPQYNVGWSRNLEMGSQLLMDEFKGRLRVAGASFHGISVNDCVRSAYVAADRVAKDEKGSGLEDLGEEWVATSMPGS